MSDIIVYGKTWRDFLNEGLNEPWTLIEVKTPHAAVPELMLIGTTNTNGGGCDCCYVVTGSDIIIRYRKLRPESFEAP